MNSSHDPTVESQYIEPTLASRLKLTALTLTNIAIWISMKIWWPPCMDYLKTLSICESLPWYRGIFLGFMFLFWLASFMTASAALKVFRSGQSPFPGAWVWSRTKIQTGWRAKIDGCSFVLVSATCFIGPLLAAYYLEVNIIFCYPLSCGC